MGEEKNQSCTVALHLLCDYFTDVSFHYKIINSRRTEVMPVDSALNIVPFIQEVPNIKVTDAWRDRWMDRWIDGWTLV